MEKNMIVAEMVQSSKSNNQVWFVHVTGVDKPELQGYCKQPLTAIRLAFVLKQRSGFNISDTSLQTLRQLHKASKQPAEPAQPAEPEVTVPAGSPEGDSTPAKQRKTRRTKREKAAQ
ncbi:MAG: hypothetical protein IJ142_00320 [Bacteroidaceae bacterium]|nr:hypothetical protein [Bacteroidaceae bacterium]